MKKIVHIISHSHLDREWYLPLEVHKMYLANLFDDVLKLSKDKEFSSFHLDGQILPIEDYLAIKPENRNKILKLIKDEKLKIGPWYILQDDFLISSESNLRNLQVGIYEGKRYLPKDVEQKDHMNIGYFPDTFGNAGQIPQILKRSNIDIAYFGRGVKATGFNNVVLEDYSSRNSEVLWQSPDGSTVTGVLFSNWYSNGNEIPADKKNAKIFWEQKLKDAEKYAATDHLLMMNGCDHQPLQMDILKAIKTANELYEDYEFIHSNLNYYNECVKKEVFKKNTDLTCIKGELRSQNTDGWGTLQGTSSNRVYLKQKNKECEMLLEEVVEPLLTMVYKKSEYPLEKLNYTWKKLLTNHPHDSICGCGIDSIHKGMEDRFKEVEELSHHFVKLGLENYRDNVNTKNINDKLIFTVFNTTQFSDRKLTKVNIDIEKKYFREGNFENIYQSMLNNKIDKYSIYDTEGNLIENNVKFKDLGVVFDYDLPFDAFRQPYWTRRIELEFMLDLKAFERKTFVLKKLNEKQEKEEKILIKDNNIETSLLKIKVNENGTINVFDKRTKKTFENLTYLEDVGDIGNEYIFKQSLGEKITTLDNKNAKIKINRINEEIVEIIIKEKMSIPVSADDTLDKEQRALLYPPERIAGRSKKHVKMEFEKIITVKEGSSTLKVKLNFENKAKDHRLRMMFKNSIKTKVVNVESIFEVVKRDIKPLKTWTNPDNSQNLNRFVNLFDEKEKYGFTIGTKGLEEYEVLKENNELAISLGRYTGELGDWGYFMTPEAQALRKFELELYVDFHGQNQMESFKNVLKQRVDFVSIQIPSNQKSSLKNNEIFDVKFENCIISAFKRNYNRDKILRIVNLTSEEEKVIIKNSTEMDILEEKEISKKSNTKKIKGYEIRTFKLEE